VPSDVSAPAYLRGFQTLDAKSAGAGRRIPDWLTGTLLRVGPARLEVGPDRYRHWVDGAGMIHKFAFAAARVGYANRCVRGTAFLADEGLGRITCRNIPATLF
jgi:beta,beta-carotene 9',10'-dioxygenase